MSIQQTTTYTSPQHRVSPNSLHHPFLHFPTTTHHNYTSTAPQLSHNTTPHSHRKTSHPRIDTMLVNFTKLLGALLVLKGMTVPSQANGPS